MKKIFLSYKHQDPFFSLETLLQFLRKNDCEVIWDQGTVAVGDHQMYHIKQGITECDFVLALVTPASFEQPWLLRELYEAVLQEKVRGRKVLLPVLVGTMERSQLIASHAYANWMRTDPFFCMVPDGNDFTPLLHGLQNITSREIPKENYSILPIREDTLEIYRTGDNLAFRINEKLKYRRTVDSYLLTGFDKGEEFKHVVKCKREDRMRIKDILDQYQEITVTGSGEPLPPHHWLIWFLDTRFPVTTTPKDVYCNNLEQ